MQEIFKKRTLEGNKTASESSAGQPPEGEYKMYRRDFLKLVGGMASVLLFGQKFGSAQEDKGTEKTKESKEVAKKEITKELAQKLQTEKGMGPDSYAETALQTSLMVAAEVSAANILEKIGLHHSTPLSDREIVEMLKEKPIEGIIKAGVFAPVTEEALFRLLPSGTMDLFHNKSIGWEFGVPFSYLFAKTHQETLYIKDKFGQEKEVKTVPLAQFMGGLFYWYLMRKRGFSHAVLAHSTSNAIPFAIGAALFKIYPEEEAKKKLGIKEKDKIESMNLPPKKTNL